MKHYIIKRKDLKRMLKILKKHNIDKFGIHYVNPRTYQILVTIRTKIPLPYSISILLTPLELLIWRLSCRGYIIIDL